MIYYIVGINYDPSYSIKAWRLNMNYTFKVDFDQILTGLLSELKTRENMTKDFIFLFLCAAPSPAEEKVLLSLFFKLFFKSMQKAYPKFSSSDKIK